MTTVEQGRGREHEGAGDDGRPERPPEVEPYLRGAAWPAVPGVPYPRADPADAGRLPADTWATSTVPAGVRLELVGDATHVDIEYVTATDQLGYRGPGAGTTFTVWRAGVAVDEQPARLGAGSVRLRLSTAGSGGDGLRDPGPGAPGTPGPVDDRAVVYLPEGMKPLVTAVAGVDGTIAPAPRQPRWVAYGDSITEGWVATGPAMAWPAIAGRRQGLDVVNLGYAGSARGEIASAEQVAALDADVVSLAHGTNCWTRVPHSSAMMRAATEAFLGIVRAGHPGVPIVVASPVVRPDAEGTPNRLGATLADLREAIEDATRAVADDLVTLVPGADLLDTALLADGIHPGDEGHQTLAHTLGAAVRAPHDGRVLPR